MPRKSRVDELREKFEAAIEKGLVSESAAERTQALRSAGDMLNPNLTDLQKQFKQAEDAREAAESALKTAQTALDAANAELGPLREQAAKFVTMETEYVDLKTNLDARIAAMRDELVAEAQRHSWDAQRSENSAKETLKTAQAQFGARGQQILLDEVKRIFEENHVEEPDPARLPKGISPLYLTLFGHSPIKAQLVMAFAKSFPEPSQAFRQTLLSYLKETLPLQQFAGAELPKPIENLADKISVLTEMAKRWNVWTDIQREFEAMQIERQAAYLRNHNAAMSAQEHDAAQRGEGRTPIGVAKPVSSVPLSEHGLECSCSVCGGPPPASDWNGYIPADTSMLPTPETREDDER